MEAVNCHPDAYLLSEPFNKQWGKFSHVKSVSGIDAAIHSMQVFTGFKHTMGNTASFDSDGVIYHHILNHHPRVILLTRDNMLRRAVSMSMSAQTQVWHVNRQPDARERISQFEFQPLWANYIEKILRTSVLWVEACEAYLREHGIIYRKMTYENLMGEDVLVGLRIKRFMRVLKTLGLSRDHPKFNPSKLEVILSPKNKLNSREVYRRVPNIDEIEEVFGSPENGYLFR